MSWRADNKDGTRNFNWYCPGCDRYHGVSIDGPKKWGFNEDWERPTLMPSVLVNHDADGKLPADCALSDYVPRHRCHVFIRSGQIQFLGDCTHHLAGQTVPLPTDDPWHKDEEE